MVDNLTVKKIYNQIEDPVNELQTNLNILDVDLDNIKESITKDVKVVKDTLDDIEEKVQRYKVLLADFFDSIEKPYYDNSISIYNESLKVDSPDYILDRYRFKRLMYDGETFNFFRNRVSNYTSWKFPAVEIRPALGEVTDLLVSGDPLYLVDTYEECFKEIKTKFTPDYQRRLRYYVIDESIPTPLGVLPQNQIGLIVAVDFFNFRPLPVIERYAKSMFSTLRPGGHAIFTYNNCDIPIGVENFESQYYCYTPGRQVKKMFEDAGFRVIGSFDLDSNVSWLEIQKPGTPSSLRGGQNLAKIKDLTNPAS